MSINDGRGKRRIFVPRFRRHLRHIVDVDIDDKQMQEKIDEDLKSNFTWNIDQNSSDLKIKEEDPTMDYFHEENQSNEFDLIVEQEKEILFDLNLLESNQEKKLKFISEFNEKNKENYSLHSSENEQINIDLNENKETTRFTLIDSNHIEQIDVQTKEFQQDICYSSSIETNNNQDRLNSSFSSFNEEKQIQFDLEQQEEKEEKEEKNVIDEQTKISFDLNGNTLINRINEIDVPLNSVEDHLFDFDQGNLCRWNYSMDEEVFIQFDYQSSEIDLFHCLTMDLIESKIDFIEDLSNSMLNFSVEDEFCLVYSLKEDFLSWKDWLKNELNEDQIHFDLNEKERCFISRKSFLDDLIEVHFDLQSNKFQRKIDLFNEHRSINISLPSDLIECFHRILSPSIDFNEIKQIYSIFDSFHREDWMRRCFFIDDLYPNERTFRRYRCKHLSIKSDQIIRLDCFFDRIFSSFVIDFHEEEKEIHQDLHDQQLIRSLTDCYRWIDDDQFTSFSIDIEDQMKLPSSPFYLTREDFQRQPPNKTLNNRRQIGSISYDGSMEEPIYYFTKQYKSYLHLPKDINHYQFDSYQGYQQFIDEIHRNPKNYYRQYDATDLRPLLHWFTNHQHYFSSENNDQLLPRPNFICRRIVLQKILSNLYCDSQPWKVLIIRMKGTFYLSLANRSQRSQDEISLDEYSGLAFENHFTSNQANTTRLKQTFPLKDCQKQYHTVQYWTFGQFNILYTSQMDAYFQADEKNNQSKETSINNDNDSFRQRSGYVEMKCTNKKIFHRDEHRLHALEWWAQNWLGNVDKTFVAYKSSNQGIVDQFDLLTNRELINKFLSRYEIHLNYCISYLYSFLEMINRTIIIDDPNTVHVFAYIPQQIELDSKTGLSQRFDLPEYVPFRYTTMNRSNQRHQFFFPQTFIDEQQRTKTFDLDQSIKALSSINKKRFSHRGRHSCPLKSKQIV